MAELQADPAATAATLGYSRARNKKLEDLGAMPRWTRLLIATVLLALLAAGIDWRELPGQLAQLRWTFAAAILAVIALELVVNAWKWSCSLRLHGLAYPWSFLFRTGCIAFFANNFLPSAIGGDLYRIYRTTRAQHDRGRAISAVLVERAAGLAVMLGLGLVGAALLLGTSRFASAYFAVVLGAMSGAAVMVAALYLGWLKPLTGALRRIRWLAPVEQNLRRILPARRKWLPLLAASAVFQLLAASVIHLAFAAVGAPVSFAAAMLISAGAGIASVLPVSISGIGVVEGAIAGTAVALGSAYEPALLAAVAIRIVVLAVSAACGLAYLFESSRAKETPAARA